MRTCTYILATVTALVLSACGGDPSDPTITTVQCDPATNSATAEYPDLDAGEIGARVTAFGYLATHKYDSAVGHQLPIAAEDGKATVNCIGDPNAQILDNYDRVDFALH